MNRRFTANQALRERILAPSIPGHFVLDMLAGFEARGGDINRLIAPYELTEQLLQTTGVSVSIADYTQLWRHGRDTLEDESLGFLDSALAPGDF